MASLFDSPSLPVVHLFTDGGCKPNPGFGGWGFVLKHPASGKIKEGSGGDEQTTNNRMEMTAIIEGLRALKSRSKVTVVTDSMTVICGMTGKKRRKKNLDLWAILDNLTLKHVVNFEWLKGHSGHPENERCDVLATRAILCMALN